MGAVALQGDDGILLRTKRRLEGRGLARRVDCVSGGRDVLCGAAANGTIALARMDSAAIEVLTLADLSLRSVPAPAVVVDLGLSKALDWIALTRDGALRRVRMGDAVDWSPLMTDVSALVRNGDGDVTGATIQERTHAIAAAEFAVDGPVTALDVGPMWAWVEREGGELEVLDRAIERGATPVGPLHSGAAAALTSSPPGVVFAQLSGRRLDITWLADGVGRAHWTTELATNPLFDSWLTGVQVVEGRAGLRAVVLTKYECVALDLDEQTVVGQWKLPRATWSWSLASPCSGATFAIWYCGAQSMLCAPASSVAKSGPSYGDCNEGTLLDSSTRRMTQLVLDGSTLVLVGHDAATGSPRGVRCNVTVPGRWELQSADGWRTISSNGPVGAARAWPTMWRKR